MNTVIVGLGNPILSDDAAGIVAARLLKEALNDDINVKEMYAGGMRLMDEIIGYERAIIIDSALTGASPGTIHLITNDGLACTRNMFCAHDTSLANAIETGRALGLSLPSDIRIFGIEALDVQTFGEELTEAVHEAVLKVVEMITHELTKELQWA